MNSYNFQLENVLEWRSNIEKEVVEKFALVQKELENQRDILNKLISEHTDAKKIRRYNNIVEMQHQYIYLEDLEEKVNSKLIQIDKIEVELENVRQELLEAQKDRKVMEKLKERDLEKHMSRVKNKEQRELDEIGSLRYKQTTTG